MGALTGKLRPVAVPTEPAERNSTASFRRTSQPRGPSLFKLRSRGSKDKVPVSSEEMSTDEKEDFDGWFPASRVFPGDPEFSKTALSNMKAWHRENASENYLPPLKDLHLLLFVHSCLKNIDDAKLSITKYYTSMVDLPFLFSDWNLEGEATKQCFNTILYAIMPVEHPEGYRIMIMRFRDTDPEQFYFKDAAKAVLMSIEALVLLEGPPKGLSVILDVSGMRMGHFARLHMTEVKQFLNLTQDVLPIIMHEFDAINCNYMVHLIMAAIRPFISSNINDMIKIHTTHDMPIFLEKYPPSCLPSDYNGELDSLETHHNANLDRINKLVPYWQERQIWIDSRRLHHKSCHRLHGATHATTSSTGTNRPSRATTPL